MSLAGALLAGRVEGTKLASQVKVRIVFAVCVMAPFVFALAMRVQDSLPSDTLFGRAVKESGFATPLVILGFAALWVLPVIASIVGGDLFSSEDRYGTWKTVLTQSRSRSEVFAAKVIVAVGFSVLAVISLGLASVAAGVLVLGGDPLIDLSGRVLPGPLALWRVLLAWATVVPPVAALTGVALMISVVTRSSAAGIGLPVLAALTMELAAMLDGPEGIRRLFVTTAFEAWHMLLTEPRTYLPLVHGAIVSATYFTIAVGIAYRVFTRRDFGG